MRVVRRLQIVTLLCLVASALAGDAPGDALLAEARRIVAQARTTEYQHATKVDEPNGVYKLDCSAFVGLALKHAAPEALAQVPHTFGKKRPLAADFYECFTGDGKADRPRWTQVQTVADALPGDILCWRRANVIAGEDTGHVMIVDSVPERVRDGLFKVRIIDSTKGAHGDDTRRTGESGVGRGSIWVSADAQGQPQGYCWSSPERKPRVCKIAIGRVLSLKVEAVPAETR
ncbi:MAG TPA: hypothetical protein VGP72_03310 [Planctomycetota bacterium]